MNQNLSKNGEQIEAPTQPPPWYIRIFVFSVLMIFAPQIASSVAKKYGVDIDKMPPGEFFKNLLITAVVLIAVGGLVMLVIQALVGAETLDNWLRNLQ